MTVAVELPPALVAVTVYNVELVTSVGVPLMAPVEVSNDKPSGSVGEIDHEVTAPPLEVGMTVDKATFFVSVKELGLYVMEDGAASVIVNVTVAVALPPELLASTVYVAVEVSSSNTCVILDNGSVSCWGRNNYGQLGIGNADDKNSPQQTTEPFAIKAHP